MSVSEPFTVITSKEHAGPGLFDEYRDYNSAKLADQDVQLTAALRTEHPELIVTTVPTYNLDLLQFAAAGYAEAELDLKGESIMRLRGFIGPRHRGASGSLAEAIPFAKYRYRWSNEDFIVYTVGRGYSQLQYVLKEPRGNEGVLDHSSVTDALIMAMGAWLTEETFDYIYVYDGYWRRDNQLWNEVQKASWDNVILDPDMKKELTEVIDKFFDSKDVYDEFGVPWKRGLIFHGPVGNGKTISIKALMHTIYQRKPPTPALYVKAAYGPYDIRFIFQMARAMSPCMLIWEDIETIVTYSTRSYFFNEIDGLENNDGIFMIASTNYLERLDPGLSKRPSRFDRKYLFPIPSKEERILYCAHWRDKTKNKPRIEFPKKLCIAIAGITDGFSFAYLQEAFVSTLLVLARNHTSKGSVDAEDGDGDSDSDEDDLDKYEFWVVMKEQVRILREDMDTSHGKHVVAPHSGLPENNHNDLCARTEAATLGPTTCGLEHRHATTQPDRRRGRAEGNLASVESSATRDGFVRQNPRGLDGALGFDTSFLHPDRDRSRGHRQVCQDPAAGVFQRTGRGVFQSLARGDFTRSQGLP